MKTFIFRKFFQVKQVQENQTSMYRCLGIEEKRFLYLFDFIERQFRICDTHTQIMEECSKLCNNPNELIMVGVVIGNIMEWNSSKEKSDKLATLN